MEYLFVLFFLLFGLFFILKLMIGNKIFNEAAGHFVYDIIKALIRFPFRVLRYVFTIIGRSIKLLIRRD